ncbi:Arabinan endo-1,5-alpha-L-arabinosidase [Venustampulla echinocandica]|uniref:Arabinan endo-1,5-alpha-L-arabinosidase n=1 Tax=Venustampulla echinocandica TaxID=2656787 RepID=A0A370TST2_9HELO|nr:Arabinan endo-1,5-alpha-L-arabinosidase [Venustampulla echinocandica]RDL38591.1 Arabinan endo-1,5-alpha-L-arabinosidase [Venustampulla echinocandica]
MFLIPHFLLIAASFCSAVAADGYPLAHNSSLVAHDPNILQYKGSYYLFKGGVSIPFYKAQSLNGPWEDVGTVLSGLSIIPKENQKRPWALSVIQKNGVFYCFYTISERGSNDSAIGIATSNVLKSGSWKDHGAIIQTGTGPGSQKPPFKESNAIDAHVFIDPKDGAAYLSYGSFFSGLWQLPPSNDLLSLKNSDSPDAKHLATTLRGKCCHFPDPKNLPDNGVYSIRVGRSKNVRGPFIDKNGKALTSGGGHVVYGSNHDKQVFAPGGLGVLSDGPQDILYYHYLNKNVGVAHLDAFMGWSYLEYVDGWPIAKYDPVGKDSHINDIVQ